jgi:bifunctional non-homologous end joining protein LigD
LIDRVQEVQFDGWRIGLRERRGAEVFSPTGHALTRPFPAVSAAITPIPAQSAIIDGELTACRERRRPDFRALQLRDWHDDGSCVWAFDLLHINGVDLGPGLTERKVALEKLVYTTRHPRPRPSETSADGVKLLDSCEPMGLERTVAKQRDFPFRSGGADWIKVKRLDWREANRTAAISSTGSVADKR